MVLCQQCAVLFIDFGLSHVNLLANQCTSSGHQFLAYGFLACGQARAQSPLVSEDISIALQPLQQGGSERTFVSETTQAVTSTGPADPISALNSMKLTELKQVANQLGIKGVSAMRKGDLIGAIESRRSGSSQRRDSSTRTRTTNRRNDTGARSAAAQGSLVSEQAVSGQTGQTAVAEHAQAEGSEPDSVAARLDAATKTSSRSRRSESASESSPAQASGVDDEVGARLEQLSGGRASHSDKGNRNRNQNNRSRNDSGRNESGRNDSNRHDSGRGDSNRHDDDDFNGGRRSRRRRQRDRQGRRSNRSGGMNEMETPVLREDDVLVDISGILDVLDNYAFVRTSGYLPAPNDAFVALGMVRKNGLRKGDVITGAVRQPREGERHTKYNPLVRLDTVNGAAPEAMRDRPEFGKLTPLYPQERLRMETVSTNMTGRIIDLVAPIGKGQRGLIVSPPKAGKTMVMQSIANAITVNNPEVHLMVVLVDERPEEVTDFKRTTTAEVIASTFDRPADDHTTIAELAIARAKRLVELGRDVVVLLDGITRLGRAYNLAAPASGRILSGGVDSAALYPPKRFFGAARNIENGGSLTILATALVETGSKMDEVIFEEFKGTGNMELKLSRQLADKRIFPAVDVEASSTRREELLMSHQELDIIWKLRRALSGQKEQQALETLLSRMKKTRNNSEFLVLISTTTPGSD